jgi:hypothetical protein
MKYLSIYTPDSKAANTPPSKEHMADMGKLVQESIEAGTLLATGMLLPDSKGGLRVRRSGSEITVADRPGPLTDAASRRSGFAVLEAKSREDVIEMTRKFLGIAGEGECELCQIQEPAIGFAKH